MAAALQPAGGAASSTTLIELLTRQEGGIRLALHYNLLENMEFSKLPYHWCAAVNNLPLALHLAMRGLPVRSSTQQVYLATFTAQGVNGETPWHKPLVATPVDVARLAGHSRMAAVLDLVEAGVPLSWHPSTHQALPQAARQHVQELGRALCASGWFVRLPGPARQAVMCAAADNVCRQVAWGMVEPHEWRRTDQGDFGPLNAAVEQLLREHCAQGGEGCGGNGSGGGFSLSRAARAGPVGAPSPLDLAARQHEQLLAALLDPLRSFSFRMAFVPNAANGQAAGAGVQDGPEGGARRRGWWWRLLLGGAVPLAAIVVMTSDCRKLKREHLATYLAGTLAGLQLPGVIILLAKLLLGS